MKKLLLTLYLVAQFFLAQPIFANNPQVDFLNQEIVAGIPLVGVCGTSPSDPQYHLDGGPGCTPAQMAQAKTDALAFDWTVYPDANPVFAGSAIQADVSIPISVQVQLSTFTGLLSLYPYNPTGVQQEWSNIKSTQSTWLTPTYATAIENDCLQGYVVLNPSNNPNHFRIVKARPPKQVKVNADNSRNPHRVR